jgi:dolichyl-phosphate beta-glucosyltransferase
MLPLTVVVPAYNEAERIVPFLKELLEFKAGNSYCREILLVNDGSTDSTLEVLERFKPKIKVVSYKKNRGKGYAVKQGMLAASQEAIVFMDADGSTRADQLPKMVKALEEFPFVTGTRKRKESVIVYKQPFGRKIASAVFNFLVRLIFNTGIDDALCGFKGFRKKEGKEIARALISDRWIFDVELFVRARKKGIPIGVIPIRWEHVDNAKMDLGLTNLKMFLNLLKLKYALSREKGK